MTKARALLRMRLRAAGFSLIEVIVALAILGFVVGAIAAVFGASGSGHAASSNADLALALAEEKINAVGVTEPLNIGRRGGSFGDRLAWQITVSNFDDRSRRLEMPGLTNAKLFKVDVVVSWREGRRDKQLALSTVRGLWTPP